MARTKAATRQPWTALLAKLPPGIAVSAAVALAGYFAAPLVAKALPIPAMVLALLIGIALNPIAARPLTQPGMQFCIKTLLRWAVGLLGIRVALSDIAALGVATAVLVIVAMAVTVVSGFFFARLFNQQPGYGALVGAATAVCGASATLATSTVVPNYPGKQADVAFTVVGVNALATLAMVIYPPVCTFLQFDSQMTGVMLGGTIHDVAQVVGAGYAVSDTAGNTATIVKLFRVFLLLPVVLGIGGYLNYVGLKHTEARVPVPVFAVAFLVLCLINSAMPLMPSLMPIYAPIKAVLSEISLWGLLIAIGALGLGTSVKTMIGLGWRHGMSLVGSTVVIFTIVTVGLFAMRMF